MHGQVVFQHKRSLSLYASIWREWLE